MPAILPHYPGIAIKCMAERLDLSMSAAATGIKQLARSGILTGRAGYLPIRIFAAS